ncbi:hypothetical protein EUTSA_v10023772mg [Eutrema salsugineum]|uniref:Uncharacterized protein n=1 Tax=Eutrema salsugineum TaxID=72664 RepID=V4MEL1_EUTSA|nr:hypothetical protein EUTSA_v10023772mg [Eutrema salsugineum]
MRILSYHSTNKLWRFVSAYERTQKSRVSSTTRDQLPSLICLTSQFVDKPFQFRKSSQLTPRFVSLITNYVSAKGSRIPKLRSRTDPKIFVRLEKKFLNSLEF